jgi:hypothetical protein
MSNPLTNEHLEQCAVVDWARRNTFYYPELKFFHAVPNGAKLPYVKTQNIDGSWSRYSSQAEKLIEEGMLPGVLDLFLPSAHGGWFGLYIEMKHGKNKVSPDQQIYIQYATAAGYCCKVCYDADEAIDALRRYLKLPATFVPDRVDLF